MKDKKQNIIIILLVVIILILLAPSLLLGTIYYNSERQMRIHPIPTQTTTGDPALDRDLSLVSSAKDIATYYMPGFDIGWTFDPETRVACINATRSDYTGFYMENAREAPDAYMDDWNNSVARATAAQKHIQQYFDKSEADDITAVVNILDNDDRKTPYLTVASGIVGYDILNGIDLTGSGGL